MIENRFIPITIQRAEKAPDNLGGSVTTWNTAYEISGGIFDLSNSEANRFERINFSVTKKIYFYSLLPDGTKVSVYVGDRVNDGQYNYEVKQIAIIPRFIGSLVRLYVNTLT